jgi:hypothetical protein
MARTVWRTGTAWRATVCRNAESGDNHLEDNGMQANAMEDNDVGGGQRRGGQQHGCIAEDASLRGHHTTTISRALEWLAGERRPKNNADGTGQQEPEVMIRGSEVKTRKAELGDPKKPS